MEKLEFELIIDGGHRRRWTAREKLQIVEETLENRAGILVVARHNAMAPNLS